MIDKDFIEDLLKKHPYSNVKHQNDCLTLSCPAQQIIDLTTELRDQQTFDLLVDLTAVDQGEAVENRFMVVIHLYSCIHHDYIRIHSDCTDNESPEFPSIHSVYPAANWHEREAFDMFGIVFTGHPNLKRILMWDEYPYFPLRKEFPLAGIDVPLPADDVVEVTQASVEPAPMMGGPFVSSGQGFMSDAEPRAKDESWTEKMEKPV